MEPKELRKLAEDLVEEVYQGKVPKRTLPNAAIDYPLEEATASFDNFLNSPEFKEAIDSTYRPNK